LASLTTTSTQNPPRASCSNLRALATMERGWTAHGDFMREKSIFGERFPGVSPSHFCSTYLDCAHHPPAHAPASQHGQPLAQRARLPALHRLKLSNCTLDLPLRPQFSFPRTLDDFWLPRLLRTLNKSRPRPFAQDSSLSSSSRPPLIPSASTLI
jgi:hypothetical protein